MKFQPLKHLPSVFIGFVFVQSLFFKFSGSYETDYIFGTLGDWSGLAWFSAYGAYMVGLGELVATILLFSRWHGLGALFSVGVMSGAIIFHLFTPLGVVMPEFNAMGDIVGYDGGLLFAMACLVWLSAVFLTIRDLKSETGILNTLFNAFFNKGNTL